MHASVLTIVPTYKRFYNCIKRIYGIIGVTGVKLGAVDATVSANLAQKYGVKGYPSIKVFPAGPKSGVRIIMIPY